MPLRSQLTEFSGAEKIVLQVRYVRALLFPTRDGLQKHEPENPARRTLLPPMQIMLPAFWYAAVGLSSVTLALHIRLSDRLHGPSSAGQDYPEARASDLFARHAMNCLESCGDENCNVSFPGSREGHSDPIQPRPLLRVPVPQRKT